MKCRVCSNEFGNKSHTLREMMFGYRDAFDYLECSVCKCVQIVEIPASMSKYYPAEYHSFAPVAPRNRFRNFFIRLRDSHAISNRGVIGGLLSRLFPPSLALRSLPQLQPDPASRILDVGCGTGIMLYALGNLGFTSLLGVDPFLPADVRYPNGASLVRKTLGDVTGEFDLIMFHHSFEHLPDPATALGSVYELLVPGGHCIIRIPTVPSYAWQHYGINWAQLDAPRHFYIHSLESMRLLADRAGLELSNVSYDSTAFQFWASEQYALDIPLYDPRSYLVSPGKSIFTKRQIAMFERHARELNDVSLGDQAVFYLRKPSVT